MRLVLTLWFTVSVVLVSGCANNSLTEEQRYKKLQHGITFKAYRKLSKEALEPAIDEVNKHRVKQGKEPISLALVHGITGFSWSIAQKPNFALAEYGLALPEANSVYEEYTARTTGAIAFYQKNWHGLAKGESQKVRLLLASNGKEQEYERKQAIAHLIVGSMAVMEGDTDLAGTSFMFVGNHVEKPWLGIVGQSAAYITANKWSESVRLLSSLVKSGQLPEAERRLIKGWVDAGESAGMKGKVQKYLRDQAKEALLSGDEAQDILKAVDDFKQKVKL